MIVFYTKQGWFTEQTLIDYFTMFIDLLYIWLWQVSLVLVAYKSDVIVPRNLWQK